MTPTTLLKLPFTYEAKIIPPGKRKPQPHTVSDTIYVEIDSVTGDEAPLAMRITRRNYYEKTEPEKRDILYPNGPEKQDYRSYSGRFFDSIGEGKKITVSDFQNAVVNQDLWRGHFIFNRPLRPFPTSKYPPFSLDTADSALGRWPVGEYEGRLKSDNKIDRELEARDVLTSNLLIIDGDVFTTAHRSEPVIDVFHGQDKITISIYLRLNPSARSTTFKADQMEEAIDFAQHLSVVTGLPVEQTRDEIEILMPEAVNRDSYMLAAIQARYAFGQFTSEIEHLKKTSAAIVDYAAFLEAIEKDDVDATNAWDICQAFRNLVEEAIDSDGDTQVVTRLLGNTCAVRLRISDLENRLTHEPGELSDADIEALTMV